jgi:hypothetical protein
VPKISITVLYGNCCWYFLALYIFPLPVYRFFPKSFDFPADCPTPLPLPLTTIAPASSSSSPPLHLCDVRPQPSCHGQTMGLLELWHHHRILIVVTCSRPPRALAPPLTPHCGCTVGLLKFWHRHCLLALVCLFQNLHLWFRPCYRYSIVNGLI